MKNKIATTILVAASIFMTAVLLLVSGPRQVMGALPTQLKTYRMSNSTPIKSIDNFHNELELALADIFGFTLGTDITVSPLSFDNSGNITRALPVHKAAGPVGMRFRDSATSTECALALFNNILNIYQNEGSEGSPSWTSRFTFNISNATLTLDKIVASTSIYRGAYGLWDEDNDGAGSGLDADLLDGLHASEIDAATVGGSGISGLGSIKGQYKNLVVSSNVAVNTTVDFAADVVVLTNSSNEPYVARAVSEDVLLAETGAGGRQEDITPAQNQPLYLFLIYNDATDDLEAFADDVVTPDLPDGYDHWALISWCTTDATGSYNVEEFEQHDGLYYWRAPQLVSNNFAATTTEALDLSLTGLSTYDTVPASLAAEVIGTAVYVSGETQYAIWPWTFTNIEDALTHAQATVWQVMIATSQTLYHRVGNVGVRDIYVVGFKLKL